MGVRQHTQDVCGCPSAHTGRPCVLVSTHGTFVAGLVCPCVSVSTHRTSVAVHQYTYQHVGPWSQKAGPSHGLFGSVCSVHTGRPWVSASTHRTSVAVRQHTHDVHDCPCVSVCVRVCPSAHTGCLWLSVCVCVSISTHKTSVAVHPYTYQHVGPWTQHADPSRGLFG